MAKHIHSMLIAIGAAVTGFFLTVPESALSAWQLLPEEVKALVPEEYTPLITGTLTFFVVISKFLKSRKVKK